MTAFKTFLKTVIKEAELNKKFFFILRNYEGLPRTIRSKDLDVLIESKSLKQWRNLLNKICSRLGLKIVKGPSHYTTHQHYIWGIKGRAKPLQVDLMVNLNWYGVQYGNLEAVISRSRAHSGGFRIPHPVDEFMITFCQGLFYCSHIKQKYVPFYIRTLSNHKTEISLLLKEIFGPKEQRIIVDELQLGRLNKITARINLCRCKAMARAIVKHPIHATTALVVSLFLQLNVAITNRISLLFGRGGQERWVQNCPP